MSICQNDDDCNLVNIAIIMEVKVIVWFMNVPI